MYPPDIDYHRPTDVGEAIDLLAAGDERTELIAGGHSLLPTMKSGLADVDTLIDISRLAELQGVTAGDGTVEIGAGTRYADVLASDVVRSSLPHLEAAVRQIGDRQVRNAGTIGGNVAHADPAADLPAVVLVSEATIVARGPDGRREIDAAEFFGGMYETALAGDEILTAVRFPALGDSQAGAYSKRRHPASGYALVGVVAVLTVDDDEVQEARVGANGAVDHGVRLPGVEGAIEGGPPTEDRIEAAAARVEDDFPAAELMENLNASAAYRATLLRAHTRRALTAAADGAGDGGGVAD
jgi:carbon-monoxide dehydrogenase medium subunit